MRRVEILLLLLLIFLPLAHAQPGAQALIYVSTDPSGACGNGVTQYNYTSGNFWGCLNGVWTVITSGTPPPPPPTPGYPANQILAGCGVEYISGLTFTVGACQYTIAGVTYNSPLASVTLAAADVTNPRIDNIVVNTSSVATNQTGTAAASPATPAIDPTTQLRLISILVPANATTPAGATTTVLYDENIEWTCTASANLNCASTNNPYHGTKDIEATAAVNTNNVTLVKPAAGTVDLALFNNLILYVRSKATWGNNRQLNLQWKNGATAKGNIVILRDGVFGFNSSTTNAYQQVSIPTSLFNINGTLVTTLAITVTNNSGSIGFYLDEITLQSGFGTSSPPTVVHTCVIDNDTQSATALVAANFSGHCPVEVPGTITQIEVWGGTGVVGSTSYTGTSSVNLQKFTTNGGATATLLSGALATVAGYACALNAVSGLCSSGKQASATINIAVTALSPGDVIQTSAATADAAQTFYTIVVTYVASQ